MWRRATIVGLSAGFMAAVSLVAWPPRHRGAPSPPRIAQSGSSTTVQPAPRSPDDGKMILEPSRPVRWSYRYDADTRRALQTGRHRIGLTVNAYEPPLSGPSILLVFLLTDHGANRQEIDRFGVHPNAPFRAAPGLEPQRFLISLMNYAQALEASELQLEVGFDSSQKQVQGGKAEISIGIVDL